MAVRHKTLAKYEDKREAEVSSPVSGKLKGRACIVVRPTEEEQAQLKKSKARRMIGDTLRFGCLNDVDEAKRRAKSFSEMPLAQLVKPKKKIAKKRKKRA